MREADGRDLADVNPAPIHPPPRRKRPQPRINKQNPRRRPHHSAIAAGTTGEDTNFDGHPCRCSVAQAAIYAFTSTSTPARTAASACCKRLAVVSLLIYSSPQFSQTCAGTAL